MFDAMTLTTNEVRSLDTATLVAELDRLDQLCWSPLFDYGEDGVEAEDAIELIEDELRQRGVTDY